jgi:hypothetical protein
MSRAEGTVSPLAQRATVSFDRLGSIASAIC